MASLPISIPAPAEDSLLMSLNTVKLQMVSMKKYLEADQLMDALKSASTMLAELRTSSLSPKAYYELYMAVFDALRHVSNYLYDAHTSGKHHLADLYELVQYAGNIVPRLYLMITVGSVYMSIPDAPVKEIMKDMMEMSRGVQHPTRGLFLRHYLSGQTRDYLPVGYDPGPRGNLQDSIAFVVTNFIEMNKLWVRLQHQGHSRDREKREMERRDLRILVGTNLVRLSQLDGVDLAMYQETILPSILEQVVSCKDVIAQEYLMEVIIQVFTDEFHLHTLGPFLSATAQLHPRVNIKQIVIALIDRLAAYAAREAENEDPEETKRQEEAAAKRLAERVKQQKMYTRERARNSQDGVAPSEDESGWASNTTFLPETDGASVTPSVTENEPPSPKGKEKEGAPVKKFRGIPEDVRLFEVFWHQIVELIKARPDLSIQDITALLVSLANLSLSCYPDRLEYVDQVLGFARSKVKEFQDSPDLHTSATTSNILSLLLAPINSYQSALTLLAIPNYPPLLAQQTFATRRTIATAIVSSILKNETALESPEDVAGILDLCHVLVRDQADVGVGVSAVGGRAFKQEPAGLQEEQGWIARMIHLLRADSLDTQYELLQTARRYFAEGGERVRYTYPPLITAFISLARRYKGRQAQEEDWSNKVTALLRSIHQTISMLDEKADAPAMSLRLFLLGAQSADYCGFEDLAYEFFVQTFSVYEESISDSRQQLQAITTIVGALQHATVFSKDSYDTLSTKAALHAAKLLKKPHQSMAVQVASHLWWQAPQVLAAEVNGSTDGARPEAASDKQIAGDDMIPLEDGKRVLECLQRSLRVAGNCFEEVISLQLYCDALDQYLYYFERGVEEVTSKYVNTILELIVNQIDVASSPDLHPTARAPPGLVEGVQAPDMIIRHFCNTLDYIQFKKHEGLDSVKWMSIDIAGALIKMGMS